MRYLPLTRADRQAMLSVIGVDHVDALFCDVPRQGWPQGPLDLPDHASEMAVEAALSAFAEGNLNAAQAPFFLGAGAYRHHLPATVSHLIQRSEFLTSYTPYQPEISQGTLQYLFEFQTQVSMITGMEVANASMYDGSTACSEAVLMARRITRRQKAILSGGLHPHYAAVVRTMTAFTDDEIVVAPPLVERGEELAGLIDRETSCVVVQNPDFFGNPRDLTGLAEAAHAAGALLIVVVTEAVSLGALESPGSMGADIVVGEGQSIGNPMNFGGPYLGLFATRQRFLRQMPGRLCGETVDSEGRRGYVLTLSTREQHIRREKATSNICTNSGLCALAFTIHLALLGEEGFRALATLNHRRAVQLAERLAAVPGVAVLNPAFFNEFTVRLPAPAGPIVEVLAGREILAGVPLSRLYPGQAEFDNLLLVCASEMTGDDDIADLAEALEEIVK